ncbi:type II toxin-antitoxin system HipA family toxin, partial [Rhodococcus rhodochrous]|nr:type II toxin-antitoxin system HipA family toxin [Rhodococcus rhodochrous]
EAEALLALAEDCSLNAAQARARMRRVAGALSGWRDAARNNGVHTQEITMMAESIQPRLEAVLAAATTGAST